MESRNWMITFFIEPMENIYKESKDIQYFVYQEEKAPSTCRIHWQGYCEFKKKVTMTAVKKIFGDNTIHCERRRGTQEQAIEYCTKTDTRQSEPIHFGIRKMQGRRSDLDEIYEDIKTGMTKKELLEKHEGNALRMMHCIDKAYMVTNDFDLMDKYILLKRRILHLMTIKILTETEQNDYNNIMEEFNTIHNILLKKASSA